MCYYCGEPAGDIKLFRTSVCVKCGKDLKVCLNCAFYAPGAHWDCKENIPEQVVDKEKTNFCEYFKYVEKFDTQKQEKFRQDLQNAREKFLNLFDDE